MHVLGLPQWSSGWSVPSSQIALGKSPETKKGRRRSRGEAELGLKGDEPLVIAASSQRHQDVAFDKLG